jgi:CheY-like chemotaxis protein
MIFLARLRKISIAGVRGSNYSQSMAPAKSIFPLAIDDGRAMLRGYRMSSQDPDPKKDLKKDPTRESLGTVLIVDDDRDFGRSVAELLELEGFRAILASDGREALAVLEGVRPQVMLIDLFMPGMNGVELMKVVKNDARWASIPRVVMTAANDRMIGVKEDLPVLYKPVDPQELVTLMRKYALRSAAAINPPPG